MYPKPYSSYLSGTIGRSLLAWSLSAWRRAVNWLLPLEACADDMI